MGKEVDRVVLDVIRMQTREEVCLRIVDYFTHKGRKGTKNLVDKAKILETKLPHASPIHMDGYEDARVAVGLTLASPPYSIQDDVSTRSHIRPRVTPPSP